MIEGKWNQRMENEGEWFRKKQSSGSAFVLFLLERKEITDQGCKHDSCVLVGRGKYYNSVRDQRTNGPPDQRTDGPEV